MSADNTAGLIARFDSAQQLLVAARKARQDGYAGLDAYAPFPVPGLAEALGCRPSRIPAIALAAGLVAAAAAFALQWWSAVVDYPHIVGGKPPNSWPAFLLVTFEVGVLTSVLTALVGMLAGNGLPRLHHPLFDHPDFDRASSDGFFLVLAAEDRQRARNYLEELGAAAVDEVEP